MLANYAVYGPRVVIGTRPRQLGPAYHTRAWREANEAQSLQSAADGESVQRNWLVG